MIQDAGYEMNRTARDLCLGKIQYIHTIRVPTVPMIERSIGTPECPIPRSAPGNKSINPQRKYVTVVYSRISIPHFITASLLVYIYAAAAVQRNTLHCPEPSLPQMTISDSRSELSPYVSICRHRSSGS